jgi:Ca-activated chloride channel family protein
MIHTELVSLDVKRVLMQLGIRGNWSASMTNEQTFPDTQLPKPYATFLSDVKKERMLHMTSPIQTTHAWNKEYWPTGGVERAYLLLELKGNAGISLERAPMNVSLVLDRSGSMSGAPLAYSKKVCQFVTDQMSQGDQLSLVAFDDEVLTVFAPQDVTHKDVMKQKIETIQSGGYTNLSGGLLQGIQYVVQGKKDGSVNRVILLSDGHANEGITDRNKLQSIAKEFHSLGMGITTMGVGDGFDEELMEGIADHGGGNFYFIEKAEGIPEIFSKELDGLLSVVAQNVQLTIKPSETAEITKIYGYNAENTEKGMKLSLGDVFDQETKSILIEILCQEPTMTERLINNFRKLVTSVVS